MKRDLKALRAAWQPESGKSPAERLLAFDRWLEAKVALGLAGGSQRRSQGPARVNACKQFILRECAELDRHGFLFDGQPLARLVEGKLQAIAGHAAEGTIRDLFAYFRASWRGFVRAEAERLRGDALRAGCHAALSDWSVAPAPRNPDERLPRLISTDLSEAAKAKALRLQKQQARAAEKRTQTTRQQELL